MEKKKNSFWKKEKKKKSHRKQNPNELFIILRTLVLVHFQKKYTIYSPKILVYSFFICTNQTQFSNEFRTFWDFTHKSTVENQERETEQRQKKNSDRETEQMCVTHTNTYKHTMKNEEYTKNSLVWISIHVVAIICLLLLPPLLNGICSISSSFFFFYEKKR